MGIRSRWRRSRFLQENDLGRVGIRWNDGMNRQEDSRKKTENKLWKRVVPSKTEFAWLLLDIGLLQWCPTQAKRLPIFGLLWSAHGPAETYFLGEHFRCGYGVPWWHMKCWRAGPRKAVSRVWASSTRENHIHLARWIHWLLRQWSYFLTLRASSASTSRTKKKPYYRPFGGW